MTDAEIIARANDLARKFYAVQGYTVPEGHRFDQATHPQEMGVWEMACIAFEELCQTDVANAQANVDEEEGRA